MTKGPHKPERYRTALKVLSALLLLAFITAMWMVLKPFVLPFLWAVVLVTTTWPALLRLRQRFPNPTWLAPLALTLFLAALFLLVLIPLPLRLASELKDLGLSLKGINPADLGQALAKVPIIGGKLANSVGSILTEPNGVFAFIQEHQGQLLKLAGTIAQGALSTIVIAIGALVGCYVFYNCGDTLIVQLTRVLERIGGDSIPPLLDAVQRTVRGAAYSVLATAVAQGLLSGLGFFFAGAPTPLLLTVLSMVVSLIPFGPPVVYVPVALYMMLISGEPWYYGAGLLAWGIGVVSTVDNFLRPLFISQATQVAPILVFIGVLGGVAAFGLLGVFIGPALIAVAQWLWVDFAKEHAHPT